MRWHYAPTERAKERTGNVAVVTFLILVFLTTGCDAPGRTDSGSAVQGDARSTDVARSEAPVVRPAMAVSGVRADPEPSVRPIPETVRFEDGERAFFERDYGYAARLFTAYTERRPENPWGHYMTGLSAWKAGDLVTAVDAFERALELDPAHVKSRLNVSRVLVSLERPDEALDHIERALEYEPGSAEAFRLLGVTRAELGWTESAIEAYRQAVVLDDGDAWAMNNLGLVYIRGERFIEALGPLARATELRDDVAVFQNNLGITLERLGYLTAATEAFRRAVELDPTHGRAAISLERVTGREDRDGSVPLDLSEHARRFVHEIRGEPIEDVPGASADSIARGDTVRVGRQDSASAELGRPASDSTPQRDSVPARHAP